MTPLGALLWTAVCHGLFQVLALGLSLLRGTRDGGALDIVSLGAAQALAYLLGVWLMLRVFEPGAPLRQGLALRPTDVRLGLVGMALGVCLKLPAEALTNVVERFYPTSEAQLLGRAELFRTDTTLDVLGLLAILCVAGPFVEELFFRGATYGRLAKGPPMKLKGSAQVTAGSSRFHGGEVLAAVVSGAAFVVVHSDPRHWPALVVVASVLSYLRLSCGSLLPCLGLHVAFNAVGVLALVTGAASAMRPLEVATLPLFASWLGVALLLGLCSRLSQHPVALRARAEDRA